MPIVIRTRYISSYNKIFVMDCTIRYILLNQMCLYVTIKQSATLTLSD